MTIVISILFGIYIGVSIDTVLEIVSGLRRRKKAKESEPDGFWYFGYLESVLIEDGKKFLTFKDGKVISIPDGHEFGHDVDGGELLRIYYGCPHVVRQIENLN